MKSRERVRRAIEHKSVDRYPIDLGMHFSTGISAFAYYDLREYLGLSTDRIELVDTVQMLARVDEDVLERFHVDTVLLNPPFKKQVPWRVRGKYVFQVPEQFAPQLQPNGDYIVREGEEKMRLPAGGYFFDGSWLQAHDKRGEAEMRLFGERAKRMEEESDRFTCLHGQFVGFFTGIDMACDMLTDPDTVHDYNRQMLDEQIGRLKVFAASGGDVVGAIELNSDLGMQNAPMLSPQCYEEFVFPYMKKFISAIKEYTGAKVFLHSCGSVEPLIPYFIAAGVDCLNPVQISAAGMDAALLKQKYGKDICFWGGGCNTQSVLPFQSPEQVRKNTRELTDIFKTGYGFVFNQVHNIMGNVPPENIVAMFDEAYQNSFYEKGENI